MIDNFSSGYLNGSMKYLKINPTTFLISKDVIVSDREHKENLSHIWVIDRSGSMTYMLDELVDDLILKSKDLSNGDVLSLGWFSSEGDYRYLLKGLKISGQSDLDVISKTLNSFRSSRGATCFSEILIDTESVVADLAAFGLEHALMFLTDGYPVVSNYSKEIKAIESAVEKLQSKVASALIVGYGNYYNKELLAQITQQIGGSLIHNHDLQQFKLSMTSYMEDARKNGSKLEVKIPKGASYPFSINNGSIISYENREGSVMFTPSRNKTNQIIFYLSSEAEGEEIKLENLSSNDENTMLRASYALSYLLCNRTKTDTALEVLNVTGDVALLTGVYNAFTNAEYGAIEDKLKKAVVSSSARYVSGRSKNFLPDENAFCIVDLVDLLLADSSVVFYPYHKDFSYSRIGQGYEASEDSLKFIPVENPCSNLNGVVWNKTKLNLSIRAKIHGHVVLPEDAEKYGLTRNYPTFIWRNYTLVKDGFLNTDILYIRNLSDVSLNKLEKVSKEIGVNLLEKAGDYYALHLHYLPVMNRGMAKGKNSAKDLCENIWKENELESQIKVMKYYSDLYKSEKKSGAVLSASQQEYLKTYGVTEGGFSPKVEKKDASDFYFAKEFDVKISKFSSIPKVQEVEEKLTLIEKGDTKKKLTPSEELLAKGIKKFQESLKAGAGDRIKVATAESFLHKMQEELRRIRSEIQRTKFAFLLGKQSFKEFSSREENSLEVDGKTFTISIREVKVPV